MHACRALCAFGSVNINPAIYPFYLSIYLSVFYRKLVFDILDRHLSLRNHAHIDPLINLAMRTGIPSSADSTEEFTC